MSEFAEVAREEIAVQFVRVPGPSLEHYRRHDEIDLLLPI
jgi:hypothetical protein